MYGELKVIQENFINDLLLEERKAFLYDTKNKYPENKSSGFQKRTLRVHLDLVLNISVPKVRKGSKELKYSPFEKYCRYTKVTFNKIENKYKAKNFLSFLSAFLGVSDLPIKIKSSLKDKYLSMYDKFVVDVKKAPEVIKLDATHFGKINNPNRYVMYFVWGFDSFGNKKCLYFNPEVGSECKEGWSKVVSHINNNIDTSNTQVIISDMNSSLKKLLEKELPQIPRQNCMFHRLQSIFDKIKVSPQERRSLLSVYYKEIQKCDTQEEVKEIFETLNSFEFVSKKEGNKRYNKNIEKMLKHSYEDNFTFLSLDLPRKLVYQNMDLESLISELKNYLKYNKRKNIEILKWKTMMFLDTRNYLDSKYI